MPMIRPITTASRLGLTNTSSSPIAAGRVVHGELREACSVVPEPLVGRAHHYISITDSVARVDGPDGGFRLAHAGNALRLR